MVEQVGTSCYPLAPCLSSIRTSPTPAGSSTVVISRSEAGRGAAHVLALIWG